jgi:hypothetical protein
MKPDRGFTHPNMGNEVRVEQQGKEVRLIFVTNSPEQAEDFAADILGQLKIGALNITLMGQPTGIKEETR